MARAQAPKEKPRRRRWDRRQVYITVLAVLIVLSMLLSGLSVLFYGSG